MDNDTNHPANETDLAAQWSADRCPVVDGVVFGDGRVKQIHASWKEQANGRLELVLEPGGWTTLVDLSAMGGLDWTGVIGLCATEDPSRDIRILGGEVGHGGDGFVANVRSTSGEVVWLACFANSNPFEEVQIHGDHVLARTNLGTLWRFPLDAPERVTLQ